MKELLARFDAQFAVQALQFGAGLLMAVTAAETLVRFRVYSRKGILSWDLVRRIALALYPPRVARAGDLLYTDARFFALLVLRLGMGLAMVSCSLAACLYPPLLAAALVSSLLLVYRAGPGHDGSFQLRILMQFVLLTCSLSPLGSLPFRLGLWFLSGQLVLSYAIAGVAKFRGPAWRDGTGLTGVMGSVYHGSGWAYRLLAPRPGLSRGLSWFVIGFEVLFPLVLTGNVWILAGFLVITTLFHLITTFLMGLNGFFLSFAAAYPALIYSLGQLPWAGW